MSASPPTRSWLVVLFAARRLMGWSDDRSHRATWILRLHQLLAFFGLEWSCHAHHPDERHWCVCYKWHEGNHFYFENAVTEDLKPGVRIVPWPQ